MTFYNYIENVRYQVFELVNGWSQTGVADKAYANENLDGARREYMQLESDNAKLREQLQGILDKFLEGYMSEGDESPCDLCDEWSSCSVQEDGKCIFYDRLRELGVEVPS